MSITDELRKFAWKECPSKFLERVIGIADDIDAAHEKTPGFWAQMPDYWAQEFLQLTDAAIGFRDRLKKVEEENAKLRELVRDMNKWLWNGMDCTECPFIAKCNLNVAFESDVHANICIGWREIHKRMRELGVDA